LLYFDQNGLQVSEVNLSKTTGLIKKYIEQTNL
jgi:hypothetical protein